MGNSTMEQNLGTSLMPARVGAMLAAAFGGLGTLLAAIGLYGVIAFSVARRTREIGVRMAIGANPRDVLSMVMRQGFSIVAIGLVAGSLLAAGAASALRGLLYGITPFDPIAWGLAHHGDDRRRRRRELRSGPPRDARRSDDGAPHGIDTDALAVSRRWYTCSLLGGDACRVTCACSDPVLGRVR